jgi:3D (Asp-Asp-Asp) domain-containing protein
VRDRRAASRPVARLRPLALCLLVTPLACAGGRARLVAPTPEARSLPTVDDAWIDPSPPDTAPQDARSGEVTRTAPPLLPSVTLDLGDESVFRNTYYDFPSEGAGEKDATLFDASCSPIARVTRRFHDQVCVQGSGRLAMGRTVSFARRDCGCASICPRTGQHICFESLDPARFPSGRGATGKPITPLKTVAVDTAVIPLGTAIFVPELAGLPRPDGSLHDGCFVAEDRGLKVVGRHIDVFTGDPSMTAQWNGLVPSNKGVHVRVGDPRCAR